MKSRVGKAVVGLTLRGITLNPTQYLRNKILIDSYIDELVLDIEKLQALMVIGNPDKYEVTPSELVDNFKNSRLPWLHVQNKKTEDITDLAKLIKYLDKLN